MRNVLLLCTVALVACAPSREGAGDPTGGGGSEPGGACSPAEVVDASCSVIETEPVELPGWCEFAQGTPSVFRDADEWTEFLGRCDSDLIDPVADLDWSEWDIVGTVVWSSGCSGSHGTLWLADCDDAQHLGYWSSGCGDCEQAWVTTHFVKVPAGRVEFLELDSCVPPGEECTDEDGSL